MVLGISMSIPSERLVDMTTSQQRKTPMYKQVLNIIEAAGLRDVFARARLLTLTIEHPTNETLEMKIQGGNHPEEQIIQIQFLTAPGERENMATLDVLRLDATGHALDIWTPGSAFAGTRPAELKKYMQQYSEKLEREEYAQAAARRYTLWVQFYDQVGQTKAERSTKEEQQHG